MRFLLPLLISGLALAQAVSVPGTRILLEPPPGMTKSDRFAGFENKEDQANIMVTELEAPPSLTTQGFRDAEKMKAQRMELLGVEPFQAGGVKVDMYRIQQRYAGSVYFKYVLVLGDKFSAMVTAMAEEDTHDKWKPLLLKSLGTVVVGEKKGSMVGFAIDAAGTLKEARAVSNQLLFTDGGVIPSKDRRGPMFLGSRSLAATNVEPLERFAEQRARSIQGLKDLKITSSKPVKIAGLDGHELTAVVNEENPAEAIAIYEVVLKEPSGGYYLLLGLAPIEQAASALDLFKKMAATFRVQ